MSEMVERVARAIDPVAYRMRGLHSTRNRWPQVRKNARAAIEAMREPTKEILQAAHDGPLMADEHHMDEKTERWLTEMWQAMIDEILRDGAEPSSSEA